MLLLLDKYEYTLALQCWETLKRTVGQQKGFTTIIIDMAVKWDMIAVNISLHMHINEYSQ